MGSRLLTAIVAVAAAVGLASCGGGDGPSVQANSTDSTTTAPSTTTTTAPSTTTTAAVPAPAGMAYVSYRGLRLTVPADWPVHDIAQDPTTCVRTDAHAVYLGEQGPKPDCAAQAVGRTETLQLEPLGPSTQSDSDRASQPTTINGLAARADPAPDANGALTVVFPDLQVVVIITYRADPGLASQILESATPG